jgi:hypothetical protein
MIPVRRYMKTYGLKYEYWRRLSVVHREWNIMNSCPASWAVDPGGPSSGPITVEDVFNSRMIARPAA